MRSRAWGIVIVTLSLLACTLIYWDSLQLAPMKQKNLALKLNLEVAPIVRDQSAFPENAQMGWHQVEKILSVLPRDGNLFVFGLGHDSPFWNSVTTGRVIFVEDGDMSVNLINGKRWYDMMTEKYPELEAYAVDYITENTDEMFTRTMEDSQRWSKLQIVGGFPQHLFETRWDVIIVDAPLGFCPASGCVGPGRYQSIYTSKLLVESGAKLVGDRAGACHVFVDDYERRVEHDFSQAVYGKEPIEVTKRGGATPNEQAHFEFLLSDAIVR